MRLAAAILCVAGVAGIAQADTTVALRGTLVDRATRAPIAGAVIAIGNELVASGEDGSFVIALAPGAYTLTVTAPWLAPHQQAIQLARDAVGLVALADGQPDEDMRHLLVADAVVELGHRARAHQFAEALERTAFFRNGDGEQGFALFAEFGRAAQVRALGRKQGDS